MELLAMSLDHSDHILSSLEHLSFINILQASSGEVSLSGNKHNALDIINVNGLICVSVLERNCSALFINE